MLSAYFITMLLPGAAQRNEVSSLRFYHQCRSLETSYMPLVQSGVLTTPCCPLLSMFSSFLFPWKFMLIFCVVYLVQLPDTAQSLFTILNSPGWWESKGHSQMPLQEELSSSLLFLICAACSRLLTAQEDRQRENALQLEDVRRKGCCT